jgi:lysyl-tRNA synthetase class 2
VPTHPPTPWWRPDIHEDRRPRLIARNAVTRAFRGWFEARDFVEVETAALQVSPGNEAHLHALAAEMIGPAGQRVTRYLRTSPEFTAKKLLAAGEPRIFELARVWRNRERGPLHHPEFTMLEWYRTEEPYETLMDDCAALVALAAETAEAKGFTFRGRSCDPFAAPERITVAGAFERFAGVDLMATIAANGEADREGLARQVGAAGIRIALDDSWSDIFSRVIVEKIEPALGIGRPAILYEYPIIEAALARPVPGRPRLAERFELYVCGVEVANCFGELTDAAEQRRRFEADMVLKQRLYGERYPIDEDFLAALAAMPPASGGALGFDRLVMLATGAARIDDVLWTPVAPTPPAGA